MQKVEYLNHNHGKLESGRDSLDMALHSFSSESEALALAWARLVLAAGHGERLARHGGRWLLVWKPSPGLGLV